MKIHHIYPWMQLIQGGRVYGLLILCPLQFGSCVVDYIHGRTSVQGYLVSVLVSLDVATFPLNWAIEEYLINIQDNLKVIGDTGESCVLVHGFPKQFNAVTDNFDGALLHIVF